MVARTNSGNVSEFYANKSVFITGGTGFLGKLLIEKLARSCPEIGTIYVLVRVKKGLNVHERLKQFLTEPVFKKLNEKQDAWRKKVVPILGDITKLNLGISPEERELLKNNVHVIFHAAATVRFDDPLKEALITNTRGTREICHLANDMKKLEVFVHVSTAYSNMDKYRVEETLYPARADWKKMIEMAEVMDAQEVQVISEKLRYGFPNTYTFTKSLSEQCVYDLCNGKVPTVILRPSIVIGTLEEPVPGWIDNFNGPIGICIGVGKGVLHTFLCDVSTKMNMIPADAVVKTIIISAYRKLKVEDADRKNSIKIYNLCTDYEQLISLAEVQKISMELNDEYPLSNSLWYPSVEFTSSKFVCFVKTIMYHLLPALLIDCIFRLSNLKPFLFKLQKKIYVANTVLKPFCSYEWDFVNANFFELLDWANGPNQDEEFRINFTFEHKRNIKDSIFVAKEYLLKEGLNWEKDRKQCHRMKLVHIASKTLVKLGLLYLILVKYNLLGWFLSFFANYYNRIADHRNYSF